MEKETTKRIFKQHYAKMYRMAMTVLNDEQECRDVISDIFVYLIQKNIVLHPDSEEQYLIRCVRNQCFKKIRDKDMRREAQEHYTSEQDEENDERMEEVIEFVVCNLCEQDQRIFSLRFTEGFSYEEIADIEGMSKVAVWKHLSGIINQIKKHFNHH